jgi:hypothetical protein
MEKIKTSLMSWILVTHLIVQTIFLIITKIHTLILKNITIIFRILNRKLKNYRLQMRLRRAFWMNLSKTMISFQKKVINLLRTLQIKIFKVQDQKFNFQNKKSKKGILFTWGMTIKLKI